MPVNLLVYNCIRSRRNNLLLSCTRWCGNQLTIGAVAAVYYCQSWTYFYSVHVAKRIANALCEARVGGYNLWIYTPSVIMPINIITIIWLLAPLTEHSGSAITHDKASALGTYSYLRVLSLCLVLRLLLGNSFQENYKEQVIRILQQTKQTYFSRRTA